MVAPVDTARPKRTIIVRCTEHPDGGRVSIDGKALDPSESLRYRQHSPTGFAWGYGGSGPAQLALAILLKFTDAPRALELYQEFKARYVATWPQSGGSFAIPIEEWLESKSNQ